MAAKAQSSVEGRDRARNQEKPGREAELRECATRATVRAASPYRRSLTDNRNAPRANIRAGVSKYGRAYGREKRLRLLHVHRVGSILYPGNAGDTDSMLEAAIEPVPTNRFRGSDGHEFLCRPADFAAVRDALEAKLGPPQSAKSSGGRPTTVPVNDSAGETLSKLLTRSTTTTTCRRLRQYEMSDALMENLSAA